MVLCYTQCKWKMIYLLIYWFIIVCCFRFISFFLFCFFYLKSRLSGDLPFREDRGDVLTQIFSGSLDFPPELWDHASPHGKFFSLKMNNIVFYIYIFILFFFWFIFYLFIYFSPQTNNSYWFNSKDFNCWSCQKILNSSSVGSWVV